jgi:TonB family protein
VTSAMDHVMAGFPVKRRGQAVLDEVVACILGAAFTFGIFLGMAHFTEGADQTIVPEMEDLRAVSIPPEPPPPITQTTVAPQAAVPLAGLDITANDSPVKLEVIPPDLAPLLPPMEEAPPATIQSWHLHTELRPRVEASIDFQRVFSVAEVDKRPAVVRDSTPKIPRAVRKNAVSLRVVLLMVIDTKGLATSVRIVAPSGNDKFDTIVADCVRDEWIFSPAMKNGKRVKCLVQRAVTLKWSGSALEL